MPVPTDRWTAGGWNSRLPQFHRLAKAVGVDKDIITPEDLQEIFKRTASEKLFVENVEAFIAATDTRRGTAGEIIEHIEEKLGTAAPVPFMSMEGIANPFEFIGVAIWPAGITNWTKLRLEQIWTAEDAGAQFKRIVCLGSSRVCNAPADRKHPLIAGVPEGQEPTEKELQRQVIDRFVVEPDVYVFPDLPETNEQGKPLSLEQQLQHLMHSGQYDELIGGEDIYVPSTPNSLYVPLHVRRVLGHDNVWFSQAGARVLRGVTDSWWPSLQNSMTLPNGIIRLWIELQLAGCID